MFGYVIIFSVATWIWGNSVANFVQDKLIMVSSSIITNCQLSTKMIEGIHIFLVWRESWQELSPYYRWLCIYWYCFVLHHVRNGGRKCYLMQNSCIVFKSSDFSFVWISSSGFFFAENLCICVKSEEICVKQFMFFRALGLRWVAEAWSVYWYELTVMWRWVTFSGGFSFLRRMHNVHCKKIFFAKMQGLYWV